MRIYLVGFMGSGKTTLGAAVAARLNIPFIDTDQLIEATEEASIYEIITDKGEYHFRDLEVRALAKTLSWPKALISTGGGMPCFHNNMDRICQDGITMYLEWSWDQLRNHLETVSTANRPLLAGEKTDAHWGNIKSLFESRRQYYEQAAMTIEMSDDFEKNEMLLLKACNYIWK